MSFTLHGLAASNGIAIGQAHLISQATLEVSHLVISPRMVDKEVARFEAALEQVRSEFAAMKSEMGKSPTDIAAFIDLHLMILADPELSEVPQQILRERRCLPARAEAGRGAGGRASHQGTARTPWTCSDENGQRGEGRDVDRRRP